MRFPLTGRVLPVARRIARARPGCWEPRRPYKPLRRRVTTPSRRSAHRSPLLETFAAIDRTSLCGLERDRRFFTALRTNGLVFDSLYAGGTSTCARRAVRFARLAPLGLVLKALIGEKHLFAGGENKFSRTFGALQDPIVVFHTLLRNHAGKGVAAELPCLPFRGLSTKNLRCPHA